MVVSLPPFALAAVMNAPESDLELREYPLPNAPLGGALVRVRCCTICRSDLHTWRGTRPGPTPAILGHEIVGNIAELGEGLTHDAADQPLSIGDRVTWTLHSCCGKCAYCTGYSLPMKCRQLHKYGHDTCDQPPHLRGGFAEFCLIDAGTSVLKIPDTISDEVAAPANCATATVVAACDAAEIAPGCNVLIQGAGALGCYAAAYATHAGCRRVIVADVDPSRLEFIQRFGATHCLDVTVMAPGEFSARVHKVTDGFGADCALELTGAPAVVPAGLASLRKGGRYVEVGCSFPDATATIDMSTILWRRLTIRGVHNYDTSCLVRAVRFLDAARGRFPFDQIVGARFPLDQINEAMGAALSSVAMRIAVIFEV